MAITTPPDPNARLERLIGAVLRELPLRRAPATLQARVLQAIEHRSRHPWWQSGYAHWPAAARVCFLVGGAVMAVLVALASSQLVGGLESSSTLSGISSGLTPAAASVRVTAETLSLIVRSIPAVWLYGGLALIATLYATLFGIGAAAYRTLYAHR
jgi:hypothetical protein